MDPPRLDQRTVAELRCSLGTTYDSTIAAFPSTDPPISAVHVDADSSASSPGLSFPIIHVNPQPSTHAGDAGDSPSHGMQIAFTRSPLDGTFHGKSQ